MEQLLVELNKLDTNTLIETTFLLLPGYLFLCTHQRKRFKADSLTPSRALDRLPSRLESDARIGHGAVSGFSRLNGLHRERCSAAAAPRA